MANLTGPERARYVQMMFTRIAGRYDRMNRLMTAGQDLGWRREVIRLARLAPGSRLLDLGAGTGDLAREARRQCPSCRPLAADFTLEMMRVGRDHSPTPPMDWAAADARWLPFPGKTFDAVVSGFLVRNVSDLRQSLSEQFRVLKPGGRIIILDTTPPPANLLAPFIRFHLHTIIPVLGRIVSGQGEAYEYLPDSTESFLQPEQLAARLMEAGFQAVAFQRLMFGTAAIHSGIKPGAQMHRHRQAHQKPFY